MAEGYVDGGGEMTCHIDENGFYRICSTYAHTQRRYDITERLVCRENQIQNG